MSSASRQPASADTAALDAVEGRCLSGITWLDQQSPTVIAVAAVAMVLVFGYVDTLADPDLSLTVFYLAPIALAAWCVGPRTGILVALLSAVVSIFYPHIARSSAPWPPLATPPAPIDYWNLVVTFGTFLVIIVMVTRLRRTLSREQELARIDYLTGIANRRHFAEACDHEIRRARRYGRPFTIAYVDLDDFKEVNDRRGHGAGDELLATIARAMRSQVRTTDLVARLGGDEFAVLLPETGPEAAQVTMQRLQREFAAIAAAHGWPVTASIGLVTYLSAPPSLEELLLTANVVMHAVKRGGKNMFKHEVIDGPAAAG